MREQMHQQQLQSAAGDSHQVPSHMLEADAVQNQFQRIFEQFGKEQLSNRLEIAASLARSLGMIHTVTSEKPVITRRIENMRQLDLLPHLLFADEWQKIECGIIQRTTALQAFLQDIYGKQEILRNEMVPVPVVLRNPRFRRECVGLQPPDNLYFRVAAFDLVKDVQTGEWKIVRDHLSVPSGTAYALQNRRIQSQIFSELFTVASVLPISEFTTELLENLRFFASSQGEKHIALLSEYGWEGKDFEHSFLARKMGLTLVQPQDLVVRAGALYYRTIHGLQPVHVVFRCVDGAILDPVAFQDVQGVPGLMSCLRQHSLAVMNAIGCGAAESRALLPFSDRIIRFYLNQDPLLKTIPTHLCTDLDQRNQIREQITEYELAKCDNIPTNHSSLMADLENRPETVVAHPHLPIARLSLLSDSHTYPFSLRCFVLCSPNQTVLMPGGLTMVWNEGDYLNQTEYIAKDTWIIAPETAPKPIPTDRPIWTVQQRRLGSRTAESLFWMGRYCERAEFIARMFSVLEEVRLENAYLNNQYWTPLWDALSKAIGHQAGLLREPVSQTPTPTAYYIVFDDLNPSSILTSIRRAYYNAGTLLDYISPEAWTVINKLEQRLSTLAFCQPADQALMSPAVREAIDSTLNQLAAFRGMTSRTMLHDTGSQFFYSGIHMERCLLTLASIEQIFGSMKWDEPTDEDWENPLLNALLRILGTLDAYRRTFQKRAEIQSVAQLILLEKQAPVSIYFCLKYLERLLCDPDSESADGCQKVRHIFDLLHQASLQHLLAQPSTPNSPSPFVSWIRTLSQETASLHHIISDTFFLHQGDSAGLFTGSMSA